MKTKKESIEPLEIESLDQLDQLISITSPKTWFTLLGVTLIIVIALFWAFFGTAPIRVQGNGIIIRPGGIFSITSTNDGRITKFLVSKGDVIRQNDIIARLSTPKLQEDIELKSLGANELEVFIHKLSKFTQPNSYLEQQKAKHQLRQLNEEIAFHTKQMTKASTVRSPYSGQILEINVDEGDLVHVGQELLHMESKSPTNNALDVIIFVSPSEGKNIKPGMTVHVSPSTVFKEQYGYVIGKVASVSEFPSTYSGLMRILKNDTLVKEFISPTPPLKIRVSLLKDPQSASGYLWSSPKGSNVELQSGTMCSATVTLKTIRPIELVAPLLKKYIE